MTFNWLIQKVTSSRFKSLATLSHHAKKNAFQDTSPDMQRNKKNTSPSRKENLFEKKGQITDSKSV